MSLIQIRNLTFGYDGSPETIFGNTSFQIDTNWRLGFISRNGRGKTTLLHLLMGKYPYAGSIDASVRFDYFPYDAGDATLAARKVVSEAVAPFEAWEAEMEKCLALGDEASLLRYGTLQELMLQHDGYTIDERIAKEADKLDISPDVLSRPFALLSSGERTKLLIAAMFLRKGGYLLIDEPTNHLDAKGRAVLEKYLAGKKSFLLVSHDRQLLNGVCDHVLSINRLGIEVQRGNYDSWKQNRDQQDAFERQKNEQLSGEISRLTDAMRRNATWSDKIEASKIGTHVADRGFVGAQSARMMKRSKAIENRTQAAIDEKSQLLKNIETAEPLKLHPLPYHKKTLLFAENLCIDYGEGPLFEPLSFSLNQDERLALTGANGAGKTSLLRLLLGQAVPHTGRLDVGGRMTVSYVSQDTSHLQGLPRDYAAAHGVDVTLFLTILRKLDFSRADFDRPISAYSAGQKKKTLLAASLATPAHLYLWDEPLNYVDVLSRVQIEELLVSCQMTMLFVEHDRSFVRAVGTREIEIKRPER